MNNQGIEDKAEDLFNKVSGMEKAEAFEFIRKAGFFNSYYDEPPRRQAIKELAREKWEKSQESKDLEEDLERIEPLLIKANRSLEDTALIPPSHEKNIINKSDLIKIAQFFGENNITNKSQHLSKIESLLENYIISYLKDSKEFSLKRKSFLSYGNINSQMVLERKSVFEFTPIFKIKTNTTDCLVHCIFTGRAASYFDLGFKLINIRVLDDNSSPFTEQGLRKIPYLDQGACEIDVNCKLAFSWKIL